jgi:hypothetical protein
VTIVNEDSSVVNKLGFNLIDDAGDVIYDRNRLIMQATDHIPNFSCNFFHFKNSESDMICGQYYKPITIINEDSSIVNK